MLQPIDMNGFSIDNLPLPTAVDHASTKGYTDNKVDSKANKSDLNDYMKLDGSKVMTGTLNMNNNRITNLPSPYFSHEAVTKDYVTTVMNHLPSLFLDRQGKSSMLGNLNMNNHLIQNVKDPDNTDDCANKKYVDSQISKANIKPSHTPKNAFKYLMDDVNEWSSEYNIKVLSFSDLAESPHSWDKRVLNITPVKDGKNYRFRLGLQMFPMKTNKTYSLIVELYNRDFKTWGRQETYVEATGIWLKSHNTTKFQHQYGSSGDLYYSKTLIKFKKTSSSAPVFVYYAVHFDDKSGDMNTYPSEFKNQVYILAYGIVGETDHVDSGVYDAHQAYEIEKTKMKMLVPLDLNNNSIINVGNLSNGGLLKITGKVFRIGIQNIFLIEDNFEARFSKIHIQWIRIHTTSRNKGDPEVLMLDFGNNRKTRYPFRFPQSGYAQITINRYFESIYQVQLIKANNVPIILAYKILY